MIILNKSTISVDNSSQSEVCVKKFSEDAEHEKNSHKDNWMGLENDPNHEYFNWMNYVDNSQDIESDHLKLNSIRNSSFSNQDITDKNSESGSID